MQDMITSRDGEAAKAGQVRTGSGASTPQLPRAQSPSSSCHPLATSSSLPSLRPSSASHRSGKPQKVSSGSAHRLDLRDEKSYEKIRPAHLPLCPDSQGLQRFYCLVEELANLWEDTGASEEQRLAETEAFAAVAAKEVRSHVLGCKQNQTSLESSCAALRRAAEANLATLATEIDQVLLQKLSSELEEASNRPTLDARHKALQQVDAKISEEVSYVDDLRETVEAAAKALGLDPSQVRLTGGVAELRAEMSNLKAALLERRSRALELLGVEAGVIQAESEVEYLRMLTAEVESLETRLEALQSGTVQAAFGARLLWQELGESPELPRDTHAVRLSSVREAAALPKEQKAAINHFISMAVGTSLSAWQANQASARTETDRIHKALRAFGVEEVVELFLKEHGTLHKSHRLACRLKLEEVLTEIRASEVPALRHLRRLFEEAGLGSAAFEVFAASLDSADSKVERAAMLENETKRVERYIEAIAQILGPIRELKALVIAAVAFEANVQAGSSRFSGNSLHFLEEEKFRRRFGHCYPNLRDAVIDAIASREASERQKFMYHGVDLREGLLNIRGVSVNLVRLPGDLSVMGEVVKLLNLADPGPMPTAKRLCKGESGSRSEGPSPTSRSSGTPAGSRSASASPKRRQRHAKRARSVGHLKRAAPAPEEPKPPVAQPVPEAPKVSPKPPRCPEGAIGGGCVASMAAMRISSGLRPNVRRDCRAHLPHLRSESSPLLRAVR